MPLNPIRKITALRREPSEYNYERREAPANQKRFSFGKFDFDYNVEFSNLSISVSSENELHHYKRSYKNGEKYYEANFAAKCGALLIHPIEPNHKPSSITDFLEIRFKPLIVEPESECVIFLTFPIEIAVMLEAESGKTEVIDVVTAVRPKFSMYGTSARGVLTRYHESEVNYSIPPVKNYKYGVLRLAIRNDTNEWATVGRVVFYMKGLDIFFDEKTAGACGTMEITSKEVARTTFEPGRLCEGMTEAVCLFEERKIDTFLNTPATLLTDTIFTMDMGLK